MLRKVKRGGGDQLVDLTLAAHLLLLCSPRLLQQKVKPCESNVIA